MTYREVEHGGTVSGNGSLPRISTPWPDFHNSLIAEIRNELGARLPGVSRARVDERIEVATSASDPPSSFRPDVLVGRFQRGSSKPGVASANTPTATLEPKLVEILDRDPEDLRITWVEIRIARAGSGDGRRGPFSDQQVVARGQAYLDKRDKLHAARVNLVEIDLLLGGRPADETADRAWRLLRDRRAAAAGGGGLSLDRP